MNYGNKAFEDAVAELGLPNGRLISWSKSGYRHLYPDHAVVFNGSLADADGHGFWWGDIDLTIDEPKLVALAAKLKTTVHVLYESDARFAGSGERLDLSPAVVRVTAAGEVAIRERLGRPELIRNGDGQLIRRPPE